ncbi:MAG: sulfate ABC transporter permease [Pyrobaculum arsenaticum]|uniref:sulfate ABC transporter permease n=1 Tax=Pyrobaculum arsenaticum TaxID=121277 RepID=UPI002273B86D|nr:sulfate ABC transporter permease [Pyrobaculum arsenaticum]
MDALLFLAVGAAGLLLMLLVFLPIYFVTWSMPPGFFEAFLYTALFGAAAAALSLLPGLAAALASRRGGVVGALSQVLYVPAVVPPTSVGVLLLASFNLPRALCINGVGAFCPLRDLPAYVVNQPLGVLIGMTVMALPVSYAVFEGALREERAELYFRSLGFSGFSLLFMILLSMRRAALTAFVFAWVRSFGELGVLLVFASYPVTASIYIYNAWLTYGVGAAVGASLATALVSIGVAYLARWRLSK